MSEQSNYPGIGPLPKEYSAAPAPEGRANLDENTHLFSGKALTLEPTDRRVGTLPTSNLSSEHYARLDEWDFPKTESGRRTVDRLKADFAPHLRKFKRLVTHDPDSGEWEWLKVPLVDAAYLAITSRESREAIKEAFLIAHIKQKEVLGLVQQQLPELGQQIARERGDLVIEERTGLLGAQGLRIEFLNRAQLLLERYQDHLLIQAVGPFNDDQSHFWKEGRNSLTRDAISLSQYLENRLDPLIAASVLRIITAHPSQRLVGDE